MRICQGRSLLYILWRGGDSLSRERFYIVLMPFLKDAVTRESYGMKHYIYKAMSTFQFQPTSSLSSCISFMRYYLLTFISQSLS